MINRFVLLSTQRSGSTWVIDMLNSHPAVKAYEELFLEDWKERPTWAGATDIPTWNAHWAREGARFKLLARSRACFHYLDRVYTPRDQALEAIGFKLMYSQFRRLPAILGYMLARRTAIVHLIRSNYLDVLLSEESKTIRGVPHAFKEVENVQVALDTSSLLDTLRWKGRKIRVARTLFSHLGLPYLELTYEELLADGARFGTILCFLGIEGNAEGLRTPLRKLNKGSHRQLIANYEEVQQLLQGTRYAGLLNE